MRFVCIGFLNTGLNFIVTNLVSKALGISQGWPYGLVTGAGFMASVIQSYFWHRTWIFGSEAAVTLWKNFHRLFLVGILGALTVAIILFTSRNSPPAYFFSIILGVYLTLEIVLWKYFGFHLSDWNHKSHSFVMFFIVTGVGFLINAVLSSVFSTYIHPTQTDLDKNIALALATGVALFWNFAGAKVIVFRK